MSKTKNPCLEVAEFFTGYTKSEHTQVGLIGGVTYSSYIESNGSGYQITCMNHLTTLKLTNIKIQQRLTGQGFSNCGNISAKLDQKTGQLKLKDFFGNNTEIMLPIPDGKKS